MIYRSVSHACRLPTVALPRNNVPGFVDTFATAKALDFNPKTSEIVRLVVW